MSRPEYWRKFIDTSCHECVLAVEGFGGDGYDDERFVSAHLFSGHNRGYGVVARLKEAWRRLWGEPEEWVEFYAAERLDEFIAVLQEAREVVWPDTREGTK